ncbi:DNA-binding response regulator, OmpR family, contains REC and winged-helix (wHTH) domain [Acetoanaerobium noterae]|mgnify:FL=1|uniref:Stage 0 sporulation protein A homolog n=1 Tax=Acetoanaerobium noterae TaxID=745369 RepID=A0A1T5C814_9FIRM|nr:response regulator transcription factor [Acetoanaerobium noterae]SKB55513.1 DNA-binding response regulator, OmpR family, contains REC and winged-helix (wHTH) domain [Acetoanaerobium noterae]
MPFKILIIEDEKNISEIVAKYLEKEGYTTLIANDGIEGLALFRDSNPDLVISDVMMPTIDGFEVLREIRLISDVPVIMLTAKQEEVDRLKGFENGADDYVTKPFSPKELVRRVMVMLKRTYKAIEDKQVLIEGELKLDLNKQKLYKNEDEIDITSKEFQIIYAFFKNPRQILSREQLIELAFSNDFDGFDRTIDAHIKKIRHKIEEDTKNPKYLKTKYGAGYIFGGSDED